MNNKQVVDYAIDRMNSDEEFTLHLIAHDGTKVFIDTFKSLVDAKAAGDIILGFCTARRF